MLVALGLPSDTVYLEYLADLVAAHNRETEALSHSLHSGGIVTRIHQAGEISETAVNHAHFAALSPQLKTQHAARTAIVPFMSETLQAVAAAVTIQSLVRGRAARRRADAVR